MSLLPFAVTFAVAAGLLALFLPSKQVLLLCIAAATGIVAEVLLGWWTPAKTRACPLLHLALFWVDSNRKEGCAMTTFFRHYRQRGPVNALQMRLQG